MQAMKLALFLSAAAIALAPSAWAQQKGGVLDVATIGEPPTLDPMVSTADLVGIVSQHMFETLYTFDKDWKPAPLLAASLPEISEDGKTYLIKLREGVKFHDGSDMTSADVIASLKRWTELASRGKQAATLIEAIEPVDDYTVKIALKQPFAPLTSLLAFNNSAAIVLPEEKQAEPMVEFIGTGPYQFKERKPDQYIQLIRFDDYKSQAGESSGYAGARNQYLDEIRFVPVPDANTRVEAAVSGQYGYVDALPVESFDRISGSAASDAVMLEPFGWPVFIMNTSTGIAANRDVRKAVQLALNNDDMMTAAFGSKDFFAVDASLYPASYVWSNTAGTEGNYNVADAEAAKELLNAANYNGEPLRILTSRQYEFHYKMAQVAAEYLKAAGFNVDMQVVDWATLTQRRADPALWDIYITHSPFLPEPALIDPLSVSAPGKWNTEARAKVMDAFNAEADPEKRAALWADVQAVVFDEVPFIKIGNFNALSAKSKKLDGITPAPWPYFWNATVQQ